MNPALRIFGARALEWYMSLHLRSATRECMAHQGFAFASFVRKQESENCLQFLGPAFIRRPRSRCQGQYQSFCVWSLFSELLLLGRATLAQHRATHQTPNPIRIPSVHPGSGDISRNSLHMHMCDAQDCCLVSSSYSCKGCACLYKIVPSNAVIGSRSPPTERLMIVNLEREMRGQPSSSGRVDGLIES
jgi:hypothetical protein